MAAQFLHRNPRVPGDAEAHFRCAAREQAQRKKRGGSSQTEHWRVSSAISSLQNYSSFTRQQEAFSILHTSPRVTTVAKARLYSLDYNNRRFLSTRRRSVVFFEAFHNNPSTNPCSVLFVRRRPSCYGRGFYSLLPPL